MFDLLTNFQGFSPKLHKDLNLHLSPTTCDQGAIDRTIHFKLFKSLSSRHQWPTISRPKNIHQKCWKGHQTFCLKDTLQICWPQDVPIIFPYQIFYHLSLISLCLSRPKKVAPSGWDQSFFFLSTRCLSETPLMSSVGLSSADSSTKLLQQSVSMRIQTEGKSIKFKKKYITLHTAKLYLFFKKKQTLIIYKKKLPLSILLLVFKKKRFSCSHPFGSL